MFKILIIEDDEEIKTNLEYLLEAEGYEVLSAPDGQIGITLAKLRRPDLVISDILMPFMDGYEVIESLHKDPALLAIPFIFLTAKTEKEDIKKGMSMGANDYLTKPFSQGELLQVIRQRLDMQRAS